MKTVLGVHLCWGTYGFWLPNDPRGSGSEHVWAEHLQQFGEATKVGDRSRSKARVPHNRAVRLAAKRALKYPPVKFSGVQALAVGRGFGELAAEIGLAVWACAILPDHVHLVVGPSAIRAEVLAQRFKGAATRRLIEEELHPFGDLARLNGYPPKCWQRGGWKVYLFDDTAIRREIEYVENKPLKEGKKRQRWPFVSIYSS